MKKLLTIATVIVALMSLISCSKDNTPTIQQINSQIRPNIGTEPNYTTISKVLSGADYTIFYRMLQKANFVTKFDTYADPTQLLIATDNAGMKSFLISDTINKRAGTILTLAASNASFENYVTDSMTVARCTNIINYCTSSGNFGTGASSNFLTKYVAPVIPNVPTARTFTVLLSSAGIGYYSITSIGNTFSVLPTPPSTTPVFLGTFTTPVKQLSLRTDNGLLYITDRLLVY